MFVRRGQAPRVRLDTRRSPLLQPTSESSPQATRPPVTRDRILDEAEALFAEQGFAGTSVREIAARADLTPASLYNHFSGKDALYAAVLQRGIRPLVELMQRLGADPDRVVETDSVIRAVMQHLASRPHLPRLIHHEVGTGGAHLARLARDWVRPLLQEGVAAMRREPQPLFDDEDLPLVIANWIHLVLGHFALAPLFREVLDEDPLGARMLERQTRILLAFARSLGPAS